MPKRVFKLGKGELGAGLASGEFPIREEPGYETEEVAWHNCGHFSFGSRVDRLRREHQFKYIGLYDRREWTSFCDRHRRSVVERVVVSSGYYRHDSVGRGDPADFGFERNPDRG